MISYYELLKRIEKGDIPEKIKVHLTNTPRVYEAEYDEGDFSHYFIYDGDTDENYHYYLAEDFLESSMFEEKIEILDKKEIPEKLLIGLKATKENEIHNTLIIGDSQYELNEKEEMICKKIHEIIDYLNSKGE